MPVFLASLYYPPTLILFLASIPNSSLPDSAPSLFSPFPVISYTVTLRYYSFVMFVNVLYIDKNQDSLLPRPSQYPDFSFEIRVFEARIAAARDFTGRKLPPDSRRPRAARSPGQPGAGNDLPDSKRQQERPWSTHDQGLSGDPTRLSILRCLGSFGKIVGSAMSPALCKQPAP